MKGHRGLIKGIYTLRLLVNKRAYGRMHFKFILLRKEQSDMDLIAGLTFGADLNEPLVPEVGRR